MRRRARVISVVMLAGLAILVGSASAQGQQAPPTPPRTPQAPATPVVPQERAIEGTVSKVDQGGRVVGISSGLFGLLGAALQVTNDTRIWVEGRQASLADIKEGAQVKASYESREGRNVAKSIEVVRGQ